MKFKVVPSAKVKRIYLLLEAKSRGEVESAILEYAGSLGWAKASPVFVEGGKTERRMVLAIDRKELSIIRSAFELAHFNIKIIKAAGTIKGLVS